MTTGSKLCLFLLHFSHGFRFLQIFGYIVGKRHRQDRLGNEVRVMAERLYSGLTIRW
jgi:hypothetical protein